MQQIKKEEQEEIKRYISLLRMVGIPREEIQSRRLYITIEERVSIKKSSIHGKGVFAIKDIKKGQLITLYPSDYMIWNDRKANVYAYVPGAHLAECDKALSFKRMSEKERKKWNEYNFTVDTTFSIIGHPLLLSNPSYLGHMCNDGAKMSKNDAKSKHTYLEQTKKKRNAEYKKIDKDGCCIGIVAVKDIKKGEEVLVSYGYNYWINCLANTFSH